MAIRLETDEFGRRDERLARPIQGSVFTGRVADRMASFTRPLKPENIATALRSAEEGDLHAQADLFEQMEEKDGALAGALQTRRLAPAGVPWEIAPADDSAEAKAVADYARDVVRRIPNFRGFLVRMFDGVGKGISASEIDWRDNQTITALRWIHPKRYVFDWRSDRLLILPDDPEGAMGNVGLTSGALSGTQPPFGKVIVHTPQMRATHPARGGVLRPVVWAFLMRNYALKDWSTFCEVFGMPLRLGKYPPGTSPAERNELMEAIRLLGTDAAAIVDSRVEIEYKEAVNRGAAPYDAIFNAMERQYWLAILGQDQTNTQNQFGSRAQTEAGGAPIRQDILEADCLDAAATLKRDLLRPIVGFGRGWDVADALCPEWVFQYQPADDLKAASEIDKVVLSDLGLGKFVSVGDVAKKYGWTLLPGVDEAQPLIGPDATQAPDEPLDGEIIPDDGEEAPAASLRVVKGMVNRQLKTTEATALIRRYDQTADSRQQKVDKYTAKAIDRAVTAMQELAAPVQAIIVNARSFEEIDARLRKAFDEMDADQLERMIRRAIFAARLFGQATVVDDVQGV